MGDSCGHREAALITREQIMSPKIAGNRHRMSSNYLIISTLGLVFCCGSLAASAQQDRPGDVNETPMQQDQQGPEAQGAPDRAMPPQGPNQAVPQTLTLPAGTVVRVRIDELLSTERNLPGDTFSAVLDQPIVVDGWVVARRGQSETGRVSMSQKAGHGNGKSQLGVELTEVTLVDGQQLPIQTQLFQSSAGSSNGRNAAIIGTTTGVGAAIGAAADGGPGAALGAVVGGAAGIIGVFSTPGKPTVIPPETVLSFRLQSPVTISTDKSQFAFQPVGQEDYDSRTPNNRPQHYGSPRSGGYPPPPPPPYYYGYPYAYAYPYPYAYYPSPFAFGFYGGYGFGGGYRRGFRR
jgi:hypothetical protein